MPKKTFCELLNGYIVDEKKAAIDYNELKRPGHPVLNLLIESIRRDEEKHADLLKALKREKCK